MFTSVQSGECSFIQYTYSHFVMKDFKGLEVVECHWCKKYKTQNTQTQEFLYVLTSLHAQNVFATHSLSEFVKKKKLLSNDIHI